MGPLAGLRPHSGCDHLHAVFHGGDRAWQATGKPWKGGVFSSSDGTADPSKAAPAVARAIISAAAVVLQNCAARGIETSGGRLSAVITGKRDNPDKGRRPCGGAWASSFCNNLGVRFPQASVRSSILSVERVEGLRMPCNERRSPRHGVGDGGYTLAITAAPGSTLRHSNSGSRDISYRCLPAAGGIWHRAGRGLALDMKRSDAWRLDERHTDGTHAYSRSGCRRGHDFRNSPPGPELTAWSRKGENCLKMGRLYRQHARRCAGHRRSPQHSRLHSRSRFQRTWLRNRPGPVI